jgi:hypothetical protein
MAHLSLKEMEAVSGGFLIRGGLFIFLGSFSGVSRRAAVHLRQFRLPNTFITLVHQIR